MERESKEEEEKDELIGGGDVEENNGNNCEIVIGCSSFVWENAYN